LHAGCTVGSTLVDQQLKEIQEIVSAPPGSDRTRQKHVQSSSWVAPKARSDADQSVFRVYKGVKCFDFSKTLNVLATGGKKEQNPLSIVYASEI
jgi:hypothetical protein